MEYPRFQFEVDACYYGNRCQMLTYTIHTSFPATGESCTEPAITPSAYTTSDAVISAESVFIVELSLVCANGAQVSSQGKVRRLHQETSSLG